MLQKQKRGDGMSLPPQQKLYKALFTLNFLHQDNDFTAAEWHFIKEQKEIRPKPPVWWYDPETHSWHRGKLITWGRGFAYVSLVIQKHLFGFPRIF